MASGALATTLLSRLGEASNRTLVLPLVAFFPTSRCNSRCVSCDWWRSTGEDDLTLAEITTVADDLSRLGTRLVVFSGGEPLLRPDVFDVARVFRQRGMTLHLLTSGLGLDPRADQVAFWFERVIVSLDAARASLYREIRGVDGLAAVAAGITRLRAIAPRLPLTARATLHRHNFRELPQLIAGARGLGCGGISFLAADVSSNAFGRHHGKAPEELLLSLDEAAEFSDVIERCVITHRDDFESGFIRDRPDQLRRLPRYYRAMRGEGELPGVACNAPWVSAVIEANGSVRPCFFHDSIGNVRRESLETITRKHLRAFRAELNVATNATCRRCVCSIKTGWRGQPWR